MSSRVLFFSLGSLRNDDETASTTPQNNDLIGWIKKSNRAARGQAFLCNLLKWSAKWTWNVRTWGSDDNATPQQKTFHSLPLHESHSCHTSESVPRLFCTTWPKWNNRKTSNLTQSDVFVAAAMVASPTPYYHLWRETRIIMISVPLLLKQPWTATPILTSKINADILNVVLSVCVAFIKA